MAQTTPTPAVVIIYTIAPNNTPTPAPSPTPRPSRTRPPSPSPTRQTTPQPWPTPKLWHSPTPAPTLIYLSEATARHLHIFEEVWRTVGELYLYPDYNGADWKAIGHQYRTRIEAGLSDQEFWTVMDDMLRELNDEHSRFLSPEQVEREDQAASGEFDYGGIGIVNSPIPEKGYLVILLVRPNGPAERAGLRAHDRILAADAQPVCCNDKGESIAQLRGPEGTSVEVSVQTPGQPPRTVTITRERIQTAQPVEGRLLEGNIGYLLIPNFSNRSTASEARTILQDLTAQGELDGLIIDLRVNPGGLNRQMEEFMGFFTEGEVGYSQTRLAKLALNVKGEDVGGSQRVPLVVLVGSKTFSAAEMFSGALQDIGRARIVGRTTPGNLETVYKYDFEDGSRAWIARAAFRPPSGANLEDTGVIPDVEIPLDWDEFTAENDAQLEAALELLR